MIQPFETLFAVPLECDECIKRVKSSLGELPGIIRVDANLKDQLVSVEGTVAPSQIITAIQSTGRDAILRGSGKANSAAVSILETHAPDVGNPVRGLSRIVQVSPKLSIVDLSVRGLSPGKYYASVRENGDISQGAVSTGGVWQGADANGEPAGRFGELEVDKSGVGTAFLSRPVEVWELIGRGFVVSKKESGFAANEPDTVCGVIARSAGVWQNEKTVCACSGKTIWEERTEQVGKGML
ncbi:putative superoxide dismutase copper chaperone Lys7 [Sphaerosporella brunnea]|uniref:Superoxide dismutase 1 copper chaperone n=1 Tax=Sphaerosporella brunnea TaxID=1250544 RepID=A0A5J5ETU9_9PEZI|nr:putative superoxide dismutase copper chaperone Lys7 [Sphaerosporella brunnea]